MNGNEKGTLVIFVIKGTLVMFVKKGTFVMFVKKRTLVMFVKQSAAFSASDWLSVCPHQQLLPPVCLSHLFAHQSGGKERKIQNTDKCKIQNTEMSKTQENVKYKILAVASAVFADQSRKSEARPKINHDIVGNDLVLPKLTAVQY